MCNLYNLTSNQQATIQFARAMRDLAMGTAVLPAETGQFLLAVVAVSMVATPLLASAGRRSQRWLQVRGSDGHAALQAEAENYVDHVFVAGFGRVGQTVVSLLDELGHKWVAVDLDVARVEGARAKGLQVFYGDAAQEAVTAGANIANARAVVVTLDDPTAARAVLRTVRKELPDIPIIVRARDHGHVRSLVAEGATAVMPETTESSLLLGKAVLGTLGEADNRIEQALGSVRRSIEDGELIRYNRGGGPASSHLHKKPLACSSVSQPYGRLATLVAPPKPQLQYNNIWAA